MVDIKGKGVMLVIAVLLCFVSCKKELGTMEDEARIKAPVRSYIVTARIDKKGTNSASEGTAVLKGLYDEETKILSYTVEYKDIAPLGIMLKSGAKGTAGTLIQDIYKKTNEKVTSTSVTVSGSIILTPLQERNLLKGLWFVTVNTIVLAPEISGYLTLKQK